MSKFQHKILRCAKETGNVFQKGKGQSGTGSDAGLRSKDFKAPLTIILKELHEAMLKLF